jgi:hypothetical protein
MKYATVRPYADPSGKSTHRTIEIANVVEPIQGRIQIERINGPFLFIDGGSRAEYGGAGLKLAIERGWLKLHAARPPPAIGEHRKGFDARLRRRPVRLMANTGGGAI